MTLTTVFDGVQQTNKLIPSLEVSDSVNYSLVASAASGELHIVSLHASCEGFEDAYSFSFGTDVSLGFSDNPNLSRCL